MTPELMASKRLTHPHRKDYTELEIERALQAVARCGGNTRAAARKLEEQGNPIPYRTLWEWQAKRFPERYREAQNTVRNDVVKEAGDDWLAFEREAIETTRLANNKTHELLEAGEYKEAKVTAGVTKDTAIAGGIADTKAAGIEGRPTVIHAAEDLPSLLRRLQRHGSVVQVDGEYLGEVDEGKELPISTPRRT